MPSPSSRAGPVASAASLKVDGFGTLGAVYSDEDRADFVGDVFDPDGAGRTRRWSPEVDSRLGLQVSGDLTPHLDAVVQVIAEQRYDDSYTPTVEWANLQYAVSEALDVRAGRSVLPVFFTSEYRKVGYANPWVRPPQEVYRLVPVTNADGLDLTYHGHFGGFTNTVRATYGETSAHVAEAGEIEGTRRSPSRTRLSGGR